MVPAGRVAPWLLLPIVAAAATLQLQQRLVSEHSHEPEGEEVKPIGPKEVVASGPGWETQRYETTGGLVCLDT